MFSANVGTPDRIVRLILGLALLGWFYTDGGGGAFHWLKAVVGVVVVATALLNFCPLYRILGVSTK